MPLTPFHMGPGLLVKAAMRGTFSLIIFGYAQVLVDLQPLVALTTGRGEFHGWSHTWIGAIAIGAIAAATGRPLTNAAFRLFRGARSRLTVSWAVALGSGLIGTLSHVALDGFVYTDLHPFEPWSDAHVSWLGALTGREVIGGCVAAGILGAVLYVGLNWWRARRSGDALSR